MSYTSFMESHFLSPYDRRVLIACHRGEDNAKYADRLKTILWLDDGLSFAEISRLLFLDEKTPRRWAKVYTSSGIDALLSDNYLQYAGKLDTEQEKMLYDFVSSHLFLDVGPIILYVEDKFNVTFSRSGMRDLLHRIGFTYKKASCAPELADPAKQRRFLDSFLKKIELHYPKADQIFVITDNAAYYHAKRVTEYVTRSRISLVYLPPYSPNLNLIERVWKLMHKHTVCNRLYTSFREFREAILCFFHRLEDDLADSLHSILTLNFHIASGKDAIKMNPI